MKDQDKVQDQPIIEIVDGRLIVNVALDGTELSASRKSVTLFSTHGNIKVGDVTIGLNVYRKVGK